MIFKIIDAEKKQNNYITLFGDGTPLRQFMHASDLAKIIFLYIHKKCNNSFNVAPVINMSVEQIAKVAIDVCNNKNMFIKYDNSKPNVQYRKDVDTTIFKNNIKNFTFKSLSEGIKEIYELYKTR